MGKDLDSERVMRSALRRQGWLDPIQAADTNDRERRLREALEAARDELREWNRLAPTEKSTSVLGVIDFALTKDCRK